MVDLSIVFCKRLPRGNNQRKGQYWDHILLFSACSWCQTSLRNPPGHRSNRLAGEFSGKPHLIGKMSGMCQKNGQNRRFSSPEGIGHGLVMGWS